MEGKKIAVAAVLIIVILIALAVVAKRSGVVGGPQVPQQALDQPVEKIDIKSLKLVTLSFGEWKKLGHDAAGRFKNPESRDYTMTWVMVCAACGEKIPFQDTPAAGAKQEAKCPKCGKCPFRL